MLNGITFGDYHSYRDFNLILSSKTIGSPKAKIETVDVPASDGVLDYTEYFGDVHYENRKLSFDFSTIIPPPEFLTLFSTVQNALHGRKVVVRLDEDPDFYYVGRITVNEWKSNKRIGKLTIDVDVEPWKYKNYKTIRTYNVSTTQNIIIDNLKKTAIPKITVNANMTLVMGDSSYALEAETEYNDPRIAFKAGKNYLTVNGTGTITFEWQEGGL